MLQRGPEIGQSRYLRFFLEHGACLLAVPGGVLAGLASKNYVQLSTSGPTVVRWVRIVHRHHSGPRMEFSGTLVGNMPSTCLKMFTHLSEPHHTMEAWRDVKI